MCGKPPAGRWGWVVVGEPVVVVDLWIDGRQIDHFVMERHCVGDLLVLAENYTDWSKAPSMPSDPDCCLPATQGGPGERDPDRPGRAGAAGRRRGRGAWPAPGQVSNGVAITTGGVFVLLALLVVRRDGPDGRGSAAPTGGGQAAGAPAGARRGGSRRVIPQGILCVRTVPYKTGSKNRPRIAETPANAAFLEKRRSPNNRARAVRKQGVLRGNRSANAESGCKAVRGLVAGDAVSQGGLPSYAASLPEASCTARRAFLDRIRLGDTDSKQLHQIVHDKLGIQKFQTGFGDVRCGVAVETRAVSPGDPRLPHCDAKAAQQAVGPDILQQSDRSTRPHHPSQLAQCRHLLVVGKHAKQKRGHCGIKRRWRKIEVRDYPSAATRSARRTACAGVRRERAWRG